MKYVDEKLKKQSGERLAECRKYRGLTQRQLAEKAHCTHNTVCRIENGISALSVIKAFNFSLILECPDDYLMCESDINGPIDDFLRQYSGASYFLNMRVMYEMIKQSGVSERITWVPSMDRGVIAAWRMNVLLKDGTLLEIANPGKFYDDLCEYMGFLVEKASFENRKKIREKVKKQ